MIKLKYKETGGALTDYDYEILDDNDNHILRICKSGEFNFVFIRDGTHYLRFSKKGFKKEKPICETYYQYMSVKVK